MKTKMLRYLACIGGVILAAVAAFGVFGVDTHHMLTLCVEWYEGFTGHADLAMLATAPAALTAEGKKVLDELKKLQHKTQEDLESEIRTLKDEQKGFSDKVEQFERVNGDVGQKVDKLNQLIDTARADQTKATERLQEIIAKVDGQADRIDEYEKLTKGDAASRKASPLLTPGHRFIESQQYKDASAAGRREVDRIDVGFFPIRALKRLMKAGFSPDELKSLSGADASAGALADSRRLQGVITEPEITLNVQDLIPVTVIQESSIDWVRETAASTVEGGAGMHAEQTDTASLTEKAEVDLVFELQEATMRTIAAWIAASKNILSDSRRTQLRSYIDRRLMYALDLELEDQILLGDGTGQNFSGLVPNATDYNGGYAPISGDDPTKIDTLRRAKTQARIAEYPVTGYVLHPDDWEDIELTKGNDLHYIFANPGVMAGPRLWGVPVADSTRMTSGEFLVGAFSLGAELFTKGDATIEATRSHRNWFVANLLAILAEMRATLAIYRTLAFIHGDFTEASGSGS